MTRVIERVNAHYEVEGAEMGTLYRWCPESVVIECDCGEKQTLIALKTACSECGADHTAITEEVLDVRQEDKGDHHSLVLCAPLLHAYQGHLEFMLL